MIITSGFMSAGKGELEIQQFNMICSYYFST